MTEPALIRVDFRLLHGMIVTNWVRSLKIVNIDIVDDEVYQDEFLKQVFELAKPVGVKVNYLTIQEAADKWQDGTFEAEFKTPTLVLIKTVENAKKLYDAGMKFSSLLIGNSEPAPKKKHFNNVFYFDDADAAVINSMADAGIDIRLQEQPTTRALTWDKVRAKYFRK